MTEQRFDQELRYQAMIAVCRSMQKSGVLTEKDAAAAEALLNEKYRPIFRVK